MFHWYPNHYDVNDSVKFFKDYQTYFIYAYLFYLPLCQILTKFYNPKYIQTIKYVTTMWNILICTFSFIGTCFTLPFLIKCLYNDGLDSVLTFENRECDFRHTTSVAFWCTLFGASKVPELIDTFLYILKNGKQHIFLHWYHHLFTGVYTYSVMIRPEGPSKLCLMMSSINFFVHTFMYAYYTIVENFERDSLVYIWTVSKSWILTFIQIAQMLIIMYVMLYDKFKLGNNFDHFGFGLYTVFAVLFIKLFVEKYLHKRKQK